MGANSITGSVSLGDERSKGQNNRAIGTKAEDLAVLYLQKQGVQVLERNFRCRRGEIDIIGRDGEYLVFVEVKYRASCRKGAPEEAVGAAKQKVICRVADYYRCTHGISLSTPVRYDVVAVTDEEIRWYSNAFWHIY